MSCPGQIGIRHPHADPARPRGGRVAFPPELPRVEVVQELPEDTRHYAMDVTAFKVIVEEISEELHLVPAQVEALRQYLVQVPLIHMDEIITQVNVAPDGPRPT